MTEEDEMFAEALIEDEKKSVDRRPVQDMVEEATALKLEIDNLETLVKAHKKKLTGLLVTDIPVAMNEIGTTGLNFTVGNRTVKLDLEYKVRGTINAAPDIEKAVVYLAQHGFSGSMLTKASVDFTEGELDDDKIADIRAFFEADLDKDVQFDRTIHASTLAAFVRSQIEDNPGFDPTVVGATVMREAKLTIK